MNELLGIFGYDDQISEEAVEDLAIQVSPTGNLAPKPVQQIPTKAAPSGNSQVTMDGTRGPLPVIVKVEGELNPFTPKSDQVQISPVASPVILHATVWRTWLFIAYSDWKMILVPVLTTSLIHFSWKGWENVLFELGIERLKSCCRDTTEIRFWSPVQSPRFWVSSYCTTWWIQVQFA